MKQFYFVFAAFILSSIGLYAQDNSNTWSIEAGVNYVNVYSVGEDIPQGEFFDEYFNINDHWNLGTYFAVTRSFSERLSMTAKLSFNEISKWGETANDVSVYVDNLEYYGLDGMINFKILKATRIKPYIAVGGGYTWIEEGDYNTFSLEEGSDNLVGAGTVNGAVGATFDITERFGVNLQFAYKHAFKEYLTKHFQNSVGVYYNLGKVDKKEEPIEEDNLDTDNDGVIDIYDLCPEVPGKKEFAGCPDSDGDHIIDSEDKCPKVAGPVSNNGCPWPDTDNDGVLDKDDKCPNEAGSITNNGCPEIEVTINNYARTILFDTGKSTFKQETYPVLEAIATILNKYPTTNFIIEGHTDSVGSSSFNQKLSNDRANAVVDYLVKEGISQSRLTHFGYGESSPVADNSTIEGREKNRRVEVKLKK